MKFILNNAEQVAHLTVGMTEKCNTDAIEDRSEADDLPEGFRICEHCSNNVAQEVKSDGD